MWEHILTYWFWYIYPVGGLGIASILVVYALAREKHQALLFDLVKRAVDKAEREPLNLLSVKESQAIANEFDIAARATFVTRCTNKVDIYTGANYDKVVQIPCGSTGPDGKLKQCDTCEDMDKQRYPHGWRDVPGDICLHGTYVGGPHGPDYICGECEDFKSHKKDRS